MRALDTARAAAPRSLTPGFAGLYQVNAVVPGDVPAGDEVPVVLTVARQTNNAATIAVR